MKKFLPYILAATMLIAGFLIGTFTMGRITRNKIERFSSVRSPEHFKQQMVSELNLTPDQQELIDPIINAHGETIRTMTKEYRESFSQAQKEFYKQLKPILTEEQIQIIEERRKHFERGFKKDGRDGPGRQGERGAGRKFRNNDDRQHDGPLPEHRRRD